MLTPIDYEGQNVTGWLWSEKLDGVRFEWDGAALRTKSGRLFSAPAAFLGRLPTGVPVSGELWGGRERFQDVSGIARAGADHDVWSRVTPVAFDLPGGETLVARLRMLQRLSAGMGGAFRVIKHHPIMDPQAHLTTVAGQDGEGIVMRSPCGNVAFRLKPVRDMEATVMGFHNDNDALRCRTDAGAEFRLAYPDGVSFAPGTRVTVYYKELTRRGAPREPRFKAIRQEGV